MSVKTEEAGALELDKDARRARARGPRFGWLVGRDGEGALLVDFDGNASGPLRARSIVPLPEGDIAAAFARRQGALLLFEEDDLSRPVLVGLLQAGSSVSLLDALLDGDPSASSPLDAQVDGRRVVLEGKEEVVLRCGAASITLRRNGRVVIRGTQVETHAEGTNRIKGASVKIN